MRNIQIHKAAGIIIKDRRLLTTRAFDSNIYIAPGGSIEEGETGEEALIRELSEELSITVSTEDLTFFGTFYANAADDKEKMLQMDVYTVQKWEGELKPTSEVKELKWISSEDLKTTNVSSIFAHEVVPRLKRMGIID
ncbi:NUDIX domain-containing protein [Candidatus Dojkabacteria bacterium]|nr:NUDIX domain-containing protein [Candidatus Dojkabacteria bacterium]